MKNLSLIILSFFSFTLNAQIVNIPDAKFKEALIYLNVDKNKDGEIQVSEAKTIVELDLHSRSIADLTGIEAFVALKKLDCSYNLLTNLDITKNIALEELNCSYNRRLKVLNITKNTELNELSCSNDSITSLDVTKNIKLNNLSCDKNNISTINLTKNMVLTYLNCGQNNLSKLDLSGNIYLAYLFCDQNNISELDVSKLADLSGFSFSNNKLISIDISQNLTLYNLSCRNNKLTALDVSGNEKLIVLECGENPDLKKICVNSTQFDLTKSNPSSWRKDESASWATNCTVSIYDLPMINETSNVIHIFNLVGQEVNISELKEGVYIYKYSNGTCKRKWHSTSN